MVCRPDIVKINSLALGNLRGLLPAWIPGGRFRGFEYIALNPTRADGKPGSFSINWRSGQWADFATGDRGNNPISLYAYLTGLSYVEAGYELANDLQGSCHYLFRLSPKAPKTANFSNPNAAKNQAFALKLWNASFQAQGTVVEAYLRSRGIRIPVPPDIRFHPGHRHNPSGRIYPVMLAGVRRWPKQDIVAVHRTWIAPDGNGKAPVEPQKMMLGPAAGGAVRLAPADKKLVISEGLETALSVMQETSLPAWAGLSTSGMTGLVLPDQPLGGEIVIACDNDPAGRKAAMTAADRWTEEGRIVRLALPPAGCDFNDMLKVAAE